jgi:PAS domain S-box-containing protein
MSSPKLTPSPASETGPERLYRLQVRNSVQYAMFVMDTKGKITTWNEGVGKILGFPEEDWVGQHASIIYTPVNKSYEVCMSEVDNAERTGSSANVRWHRCKDDHEIFCHGYMTALREEDGSLLGFSKILSDETNNKQLQDSLTTSNRALEQFATLAGHDLLQPLRSITTNSEIFHSMYSGHLPAEGIAMMDEILRAAKQMGVQVQNMLDMSRLQAGAPRAQSFSLDQDIETAVTQLSIQIRETHASVTHDALPQVKVDQGQMVRLFQNLIGNALKYRRDNVRPAIHVSSKLEANIWTVTVSDNGIGFDPSNAEAIFEKGNRLRRDDDKRPGYGLGLVSCRQIVESHGGIIWAESVPNVGSKFHFTLPLPPSYTF